MENHMFYEEIGHGRFSTVFKGRQKRSVEFVAIRRVERTHRGKIHAEVQALHSLDHANVLKFHAWFATTNHLWVVTEYCAGGDLSTLLAQDGSLPEVTVLSFGLDVLAALQYVHGRGILAVDLRPATLYINEYGILKLADFGCACNMERPHGFDGQPAEAHERLVNMARVSPSYVAPELLARAGGHSLASDCWSLGALLHEMAVGAPPYAQQGRPADEIAHAVICTPPPHLPQNSEPLNDLLSRMLAKDPATRPSWPQLGEHAFWRGVAPKTRGSHRPNPRQAPRQQAAATGAESKPVVRAAEVVEKAPAKIEAAEEACGDDSDSSFATGAPPPASVRRATDNSATVTPATDLSVAKGGVPSSEGEPQLSRRRRPRQAPATADGTRIDVSDASSRAAHAAEVPKAMAARAPKGGEARSAGWGGSASRLGGIQRHMPRTELPGDGRGGARVGGAGHTPGRSEPVERLEARLAAAAATPSESTARRDGESYDERPVGRSVEDAVELAEEAAARAEAEEEEATARVTAASAAEAACLSADAAMAHAAECARTAARTRLEASTPPAASLLATSLEPLQLLLFPPSEASAKPIMNNNAIERVEQTGQYESRALPFRPYTIGELLALDLPALEAFLATLYKSVGGQTTIAEKSNTLLYFEHLATNGRLATLIINSSLTTLFCQLLRSAAVSSLKHRLATLLALLLRHTTYINAAVARGELMVVLAGATRDRTEKVRRRAVAALGELLFYVSVRQQQQQQLKKRSGEEAGDGGSEGLYAASGAEGGVASADAASAPDDHEWAEAWPLPPAVDEAMQHAIAGAADDAVAAHYAAKTLENIFTASLSAPQGSLPDSLGHADSLSLLLRLAASTAALEGLRSTAACAASHLLRIRPELGVVMLQEPKLGALLSAMRDGAPRLVAPLITALAAALLAEPTRRAAADAALSGASGPPTVPTSAALLRGLARTALGVLGRPQSQLRVKGGIALAAMVSLGGPWLLHACEAQMLPALDKLDAEYQASTSSSAPATPSASAASLKPSVDGAARPMGYVIKALSAAVSCSALGLAAHLIDNVDAPAPIRCLRQLDAIAAQNDMPALLGPSSCLPPDVALACAATYLHSAHRCIVTAPADKSQPAPAAQAPADLAKAALELARGALSSPTFASNCGEFTREWMDGLMPAFAAFFDGAGSGVGHAALDAATKTAALARQAVAARDLSASCRDSAAGESASRASIGSSAAGEVNVADAGASALATAAMRECARVHILPRTATPLLIATASTSASTSAPRESPGVPLLLMRLIGTFASATDDFGELLEASQLSPMLLSLLALMPVDACMQPEALGLFRTLAERRACLLSRAWIPLLRRLLTCAPSAAPEQAECLLDSLYLTLYFVRQVAGASSSRSERSSPEPPEAHRLRMLASEDESRSERLVDSLVPLLVGSSATLLRMLLSPNVRLADRAAHAIYLLAQLLAPKRPHECCRALLVSGGAANALLSLLERTDRPTVEQRTLKALRWLRAADEAEFRAALAACPELEKAFATRGGQYP